jgi:hypothetical protein
VKLLRLVPLLAAAALLAGCGGGGSSDNGVADKSAEEIVADAMTAAKSASSVYVHGGTASAGSPIQIDMHLVADEGGEGHLEVNGLSFDMVRVGDTAYFKGDDAFWSQFGGEAVVELMGDRWLEAPADSGDLASFTPLTDIDQLFDAILGDPGSVEKGEETEVDGQPAIAIDDTGEGGTLYVSTEGEPYPLKVEKTGEGGGTISFDDWNEDYELTVPEDSVDISQLQSAG